MKSKTSIRRYSRAHHGNDNSRQLQHQDHKHFSFFLHFYFTFLLLLYLFPFSTFLSILVQLQLYLGFYICCCIDGVGSHEERNHGASRWGRGQEWSADVKDDSTLGVIFLWMLDSRRKDMLDQFESISLLFHWVAVIHFQGLKNRMSLSFIKWIFHIG